MIIELPKDLEKKIEETSLLLNMNKDEIVNRAVKIFIDDTEKYLQLKRELKNWDSMSDESLIGFEKTL